MTSTFSGPVRSYAGFYGQGPNMVVPVSAAALQLTPQDHGGRILNITATTTTITLPPINGASTDPTLNLYGVPFTFFLAANAVNVKIITSLATEFLLGQISVGVDASVVAGAVALFAANGTTIRSINLNATTKGGIAGSLVTLQATSATTFMVQGQTIGTVAASQVTPFAVS